MLEYVIKLSDSLLNLRSQRDEYATTTLQQLREKQKTLQMSLLPHNYKNTHIIGSIIEQNYPVKPKKKLIVIVAFITAFILAIFIVFFIEFLKDDGKKQNGTKE